MEMPMSRKQRKKTNDNLKNIADGQERPDYSDAKQVEAMIRKTFASSRENLRRLEASHPNVMAKQTSIQGE